jgi:lipid II:glycine glycyltransferase (peptidoglycan interpeptide bridge formation enzyme)
LKKEADERKKQMLKEKEEKQRKNVEKEYDKIILVIRQSARQLNDTELDMLSEKLKTFINKTI